jgi:hypothetical protein
LVTTADCATLKAAAMRGDAAMGRYVRAVCLVRAIFDGVVDGVMGMCCVDVVIEAVEWSGVVDERWRAAGGRGI